ncbi:MAG TPA: AI-2E family transporter [Afifellaceae bacterium]|nr:AI-2E family transporter [Afifellaceae bacterium]
MSLRGQVLFWVGTAAGFILFLWVFRSILLPFVMGMALAYLLDPLADRLQRLGMSRLFATLTILLGAVLILALLVLTLLPILVGQLQGFIERLPGYLARLRELAADLFDTRLAELAGFDGEAPTFDELVSQGAAWLGTAAASLWSGGLALFNFVTLFVVTPVVAFYLLYDWDRMIAQVDSWIPREHLETVRAIGRDIDNAMAGFLRGQGTVCLLLGAFYAVALSLTGLNFALLIGVVAGLISFVPYVGTVVGFVLAVGVAIVQFWPDWLWIAVVAGIFAFGQFVEGNFLQPRLVGSSVGIHPVWLMFALFAFGSLFGFVGLLLAVPLAAAAGVLVRFGLAQYKTSAIYWGRNGPGPDQPSGGV